MRLVFGTSSWIALAIASAPAAHAQAVTQEASGAEAAEPTAPQDASSPTQPAEAQPAQALSGLTEIVVTAQRRSENLQDVPISVAAVTGESLLAGGVVGTESLTTAVPSLVMGRQALGSTPYVRGVGSQSTVVGNENAVATYVDGIYIVDPIATNFSFNNIERVEVLRGPQGTLFGRNATGGLINVITRTPQATPSMEGRISYGSYDTLETNLYATGGSDTLAADIAFYGIRQGEGYGKFINVAGQPDANLEHKWAVRSKVRWVPTGDDIFTLSLDYARTYSDRGLARTGLPGVPQVGGYVTTGDIYDATGTTVTDFFHASNYGISLRYERNLGFADLNIISGYRKSELRFVYDFDNTPLRVVDLFQSQKTDSFQNEIFLTGRSGALNWTAGVFVFQTTGEAFPFGFRSATPAVNTDLFARQEGKSYAAYGQATYEIAPRTNLTAGLRYTIDTKEFSGRRLAAPGNPLPVGTVLQTAADEADYEALTWRLSVDHKLDDDTLIYASYNRGFKSGTFNLANIAAPAVRPEQLDAYEIGFKTEFFDRLIRLNTSAFYYDYKDVQLTTTQVGITSLFNAASSTLKGIDAELTVAPRLAVGDLQFTGGLSLLDAKYNDFPEGQINTPNPAGGNIQTLGDLSGKQVIRAPKFTLSLGTSFTIPIGGADLGFNASYYHNSGFPWEPDNRVRQEAYDIVNGDISLSFGEQKQVRVSLWVKNLLDTEYFSYVTEGGTGDNGYAAPPRTVGVSLGFKM